MGREYDRIDDKLRVWMGQQQMFFVATAPRADDGLINLSPKGHDSLADAGDEPAFGEVVRALLASSTFMYLSVATGLYTVVWLGVVQWLPSYFTRSFDLPLATAGFWLAIVLGFSQIAGMVLSGLITDRLIRRDVRWYALVPAIAIGVSTPIFAAVFWTTSAPVGLALLFPTFMISVMQGPATFAAVQGLVATRMRAMAAAVLLLITNLIGGGLGPPLVGWLSDLLEATHGSESLRLSLLAVAVSFSALASVCYYLASRTLVDDFGRQAAAGPAPTA